MKSFSSPVARSILDEPDTGPQQEVGEAAQDFETFFQAHRLALIAFLRRRTASEADAQEIAQESYTRLLGYGYGDSRPSKVWRSLLYRIASNLATSQFRQRRSHHLDSQLDLDEVPLACDAPSQERMVVARQDLQLARQALAALSPKCRRVFMLSRAHHKTYPEIAQMCGISVKMVEKYMSQALGALRRAVGERA
jgi:RNA polymerase sigma-70 factor (ECF subfamily)